jgi:hypothetical protein
VAAQQAEQTLPLLTDEERALLDILVASATAKTAARLSAASGLSKEAVVGALDTLRAKGLVTSFNTVVASYGARFPGLEVR